MKINEKPTTKYASHSAEAVYSEHLLPDHAKESVALPRTLSRVSHLRLHGGEAVARQALPARPPLGTPREGRGAPWPLLNEEVSSSVP